MTQLALAARGLYETPDLSTPDGRARAFNSRVDHLMKKEGCKSLDEALAKMHGNTEDTAILTAMGSDLRGAGLDYIIGDGFARGLYERPDLSTPDGRARAFNARVDHLMQKEGCKSLDEALAKMHGNAEDTAILNEMGTQAR